MNYRHVYHAGNFADVLKHALLCRIIAHLQRKETPIRVIDTHAGTGAYDVSGVAASKTGEWKDGIGRLLGTNLPAEVKEVLSPYLAIVEPLMAQQPPTYPGSPLIALSMLRTQDRLVAIEKHPDDLRRLKGTLAGDRRAKALELDGWMAWNAQVPPPERRGLVLVDPPFEEGDDFTRMAEGLAQAHRKWSGGTTMLWYPVKEQRLAARFFDQLAETGIRKILRIELAVAEVVPEGRLSATGLVIVNPPFSLVGEAEALLPFLAKRLAQGARPGWTCDWIVPE